MPFPGFVLTMLSPSPRKKVLILTGPTAIGKSATALSLARMLPLEIISADSVQLYTTLNKASNKPTRHEQTLVPHHLLSLHSPTNPPATAGTYLRLARTAIHATHTRNALPVVTGGTMMYIRWLMHGRPATPPASEAAKASVSALLAPVRGDWPAALALLEERDPGRAEMLSKNDWYRLERALHVVETVGAGLPSVGAAPGVVKEMREMEFDFRCVFLYGEREGLCRRIDARCERMILPGERGDGGVLEEVGLLLVGRGIRVEQGSPCMAIGYRQTIWYLVKRALQVREGGGGDGEEGTRLFREYVEKFQSASRRYAKRQLGWFRKERNFHWVEAGAEAAERIAGLVRLDEREYARVRSEEAGRQQMVREDMVRQGRGMKTYVGRCVLLTEDGELEREAVGIGERWAGEVARGVEMGELGRMLDVVGGSDDWGG